MRVSKPSNNDCFLSQKTLALKTRKNLTPHILGKNLFEFGTFLAESREEQALVQTEASVKMGSLRALAMENDLMSPSGARAVQRSLAT